DLANLYASLGRAEDAEAAYRQALALWQELADGAPADAAAQAACAVGHDNLGLWLAGRSRWKKAEGHYGKALALWQALAGGDPGADGARRAGRAAAPRHKLGFVYDRTNRRAQAGEAYRQALAVRERLSRDHPADPESLNDLGFSHYNLGHWYRGARQAREAEAAVRQAADAVPKLADAHPSVPDHQSHQALALSGLGLFYQAEGRTQQALEAYRGALAIEERLAGQYPANVGYAVGLGGDYCNMGRRLRQNGAAQAALPWFDKAQAKRE